MENLDENPFVRVYANLNGKIGIHQQEQPVDGTLEHPDAVDDEWDDDSIETLLLFYFHHIDVLKGPFTFEAQKQWNNIALQLSETPESCKRQFEKLQIIYSKMARSRLQENSQVMNIADVQWPYFDILFKICQYDGTERTDHNEYTLNLDKNNEKLLQYYLTLRHLFKAAQFGGELRLWSIIAKDIGLTPEECAYKFREIRWQHNRLMFKLSQVKSSDTEKLYSDRQFFQLCTEIFNPKPEKQTLDKKELQRTTHSKPRRWQHDNITELITFYSANYGKLKHASDLHSGWAPLVESLGKSAEDCQKKMRELTRRHQSLRKKKLEKPNIKIGWRYYSMLDDVFARHNDVDVQNEMNFDSECCESKEEIPIEYEPDEDTNIFLENDDDAVCIIVAPEGGEVLLPNASVENNKNNKNNTTENNQEPKRINKKWSKKSKSKLLKLYKNYIKMHKHTLIDEIDIWNTVSGPLNRSPIQCRKVFNIMKRYYYQLMKLVRKGDEIKWPHFPAFVQIMRFKPSFHTDKSRLNDFIKEEMKMEVYDVFMKEDLVLQLLSYYEENLEEFISPKYHKNYVWADMAAAVGASWEDCKKKFTYLSQVYTHLKNKGNGESWPYFKTFELISQRAGEILKQLECDPTLQTEEKIELVGFDVWDSPETLKLLQWYLKNIDRFKNLKYIHKYLWSEAEIALGLSAGRCSKKMRDLRGTYREKLKSLKNDASKDKWEYFDICKEIYGTDLEDPFLAKTKRTGVDCKQKNKQYSLPKKRRYNKKVMTKGVVQQLINYYIEHIEQFKNPQRTTRQAWQNFARKIGFSPLACEKKFQLLNRKYKKLLYMKNVNMLEKWPYYKLMKKLCDHVTISNIFQNS